jgi:xanthine/CO dehydrogenase XdhC/CoxF family maturation factor
MVNKFKVTKAYGNRRVGEIVLESKETRRKMREGGCLEKMAPNVKNKMQEETAKNKGDK